MVREKVAALLATRMPAEEIVRETCGEVKRFRKERSATRKHAHNSRYFCCSTSRSMISWFPSNPLPFKDVRLSLVIRQGERIFDCRHYKEKLQSILYPASSREDLRGNLRREDKKFPVSIYRSQVNLTGCSMQIIYIYISVLSYFL